MAKKKVVKKPLVITYTPNEWFEFVKDQAWDRTAAWHAFCLATGCDHDPPDLDPSESDHDREYLTNIFKRYGMRVPRALLNNDWDT